MGSAFQAGDVVCLLGFLHTKTHYKFIAKKLGLAADASNFVFVDCLTNVSVKAASHPR
jgi:hypothetical protein